MERYKCVLRKHFVGFVDDAYELGDYTRREWLMRKDKWQKSIER